MIAKKHESDYNTILAVCDKEHIGKTFEEGNICFTASQRFYGGETVSENELVEMIKEANSVNLFGNKCVEIAEKNGLVSEKQIIKISGVKHAQIYKI